MHTTMHRTITCTLIRIRTHTTVSAHPRCPSSALSLFHNSTHHNRMWPRPRHRRHIAMHSRRNQCPSAHERDTASRCLAIPFRIHFRCTKLFSLARPRPVASGNLFIRILAHWIPRSDLQYAPSCSCSSSPLPPHCAYPLSPCAARAIIDTPAAPFASAFASHRAASWHILPASLSLAYRIVMRVPIPRLSQSIAPHMRYTVLYY